MGRLVSVIDIAARAALSEQLAAISNAPVKTSCILALDDSIEVAGPVLCQSERLDEVTLIEGAKTKSQGTYSQFRLETHLLKP